jgi:hypothetical protein
MSRLRRRQQGPGLRLTCPAYLQTPPTELWRATRTSEWLKDYWSKRQSQFSNTPGGFVTHFRREFVGDPSSHCKLFSAEECNFDPCMQAALTSISPCDLQPSYLVLQAIRALRSYFTGFLYALDIAVSGSALIRDETTQNFFVDSRVVKYDNFKTVLTVANIIIGLLGPFGPVAMAAFPNLSVLSPSMFFLPPHIIANAQVLTVGSKDSP